MELGPSPAPELLLAAGPLSRGPPDFLRPPGRAPNTAAPSAPFDLLLQLLGNLLPPVLPGGESLPVSSGGAPLEVAGEAPATPLDPAAMALGAVLPSFPSGEETSTAAAAANAAVDASPTRLADALRLALASAPLARSTAAQLGSRAADTAIAAGEQTTALGNAPPTAPMETPAVRSADARRVTADALRVVDPALASAAGSSLDAFTSRVRATDESRPRAPGHTPAARALTLASELVRADAAIAPRADPPLSRASEVAPQVPVAGALPAPMLSTATLLDDARTLGLAQAANAETSIGGTQGVFTSLTTHGTSGAQVASVSPGGQLPPHLGAPVDTNAARWHEALASRIHWLVDHEIGEAQIKLNPPELGALDVKISLLEDKTYVQMTAHTSAARDELSQSLPRLRELMSAGGLDLGGATVSDGRDHGAGRHAAAQPAARTAVFAPSAEIPAAAPRAQAGSASRIDLFA